MTASEFKSLKVEFRAELDPLTNKPIALTYSSSSFEESELPLFQIAAHEKLESLSGKENVKLSVKYQVLSKETAMIGVVK